MCLTILQQLASLNEAEVEAIANINLNAFFETCTRILIRLEIVIRQRQHIVKKLSV